MPDDLVSRLSETLDQAERAAIAATAGPWRYRPMKVWHGPPRPGELRPVGEEFVGAGPLDAPLCVAATGPADDVQAIGDARHIAAWDPQSVLLLVTAHREIIAEHAPYDYIPWYGQPAEKRCRTCYEDGQINDEGEGGAVWVEFVGRPWPCQTLLALAVGWGITEGQG